MSWADEVESDLNLDLLRGRVCCVDCREAFKIDRKELVLVGQQGYFRCWKCVQIRMNKKRSSDASR